MTCEACGGDGQIEYGAYRGDDSTETRECRLCGGAVTVYSAGTDVVGTVGSSAASAGESLKRLGQAATKAGASFYVGRLYDSQQRIVALKLARKVAAERLEQVRQEREQLERAVESDRDNPNTAMNQFLRDRLKS